MMQKPNKTQQQKILDLLCDGQLHSTLEFRNELFIMMPATRIFEINEIQKKQGLPEIIESRMMPANPQRPDSPHIAWYRDTRFIKSIQTSLFEVAS